METSAQPYQHKTIPTLYAYRQGCRCVGCKAIHNKSVQAYNARRKARNNGDKIAAVEATVTAGVVGPVEASVLEGFDGLVTQPWMTTWKLLALQHARTLDVIAQSGQMHLAGTAHTKLAECLDRLRPKPAPAGQAIKQGLSDAEAFANDL